MLKLSSLFSDCPTCDNHTPGYCNGNMVAIEDQGIVDTRDGESYGVVYYCDHCDTVWQITTGIREGAEALYDEERESYLVTMREQQEE
jgi:hypothetical protein